MGWGTIRQQALRVIWRQYADDGTYVPPEKAPEYPCRIVLYPEPPTPQAEGSYGLDPPPTGPRAEILREELPVRPVRGGYLYLPGTSYEILSVGDSLDGRWRLQIAEVDG